MINVLLKWGTLLAIWNKYGAALKTLPFLLIIIFIIYAIHGDYIEYAEVSDEKSYVAWSFLIKWLVIFSILAGYWMYVRSLLRVKKTSSVRERLMGTSSQGHRAKPSGQDDDLSNKKSDNQSKDHGDLQDAFVNIRKKKHLRSKAEFVLEKHKGDSE